MVSLKQALVVCSCVAVSTAVDVVVSSANGNVTGSKGHPYGYGFLHEDISNSGDGGIYAELIRNRAFQFSDAYPVSLDGYFPVNGANLSIQSLELPLSKVLPASMRVAAGNESGQIGFKNDGYWGMDVKQQKYTGSFWVKGAYTGHFKASLQSNLTQDVFGTVQIESKAVANDWIEHEFELVPSMDAPNSNNTFSLTFDPTGTASGSLDFNLISLFPPTYKGRKNGLRIDIAEALEEVNPTYLRFPGGNMLEGATNATWWDWKNSLGPLRHRPGFPGVWGYQQTNGLGLMEYLEWAEDMGMHIILAVWAGLSLNGDVTPQEKLQFYIDDALNQIEFIRGPADSPWGSRRAALGHPEPFTLEFVEVGNEDWLAGYPGGWDSYRAYRFPMFYNALTAAYPDIQVIASAATSDPTDIVPTTGPNKVNGLVFPPDVIGDYHPYRQPDDLVAEFDRFDNDIGHIIGEVAAAIPNRGNSSVSDLYPLPFWIGAVGEAVSMIGYERNSDRIPGTFYAPVIRNTNRWQWSVTLIQNDAWTTTRSVSWYVWSLFAHHPMSHTLPATKDFGPLYYVSGKDESRNAAVWKGAVYNTTDNQPISISVSFEGIQPGTKAALTVLTNPSGNSYAVNDPATGINVVDTSTIILTASGDGKFNFSLPELSVAVLDTDIGCKQIGRAPNGTMPAGTPARRHSKLGRAVEFRG